jgi:hypothetical protein
LQCLIGSEQVKIKKTRKKGFSTHFFKKIIVWKIARKTFTTSINEEKIIVYEVKGYSIKNDVLKGSYQPKVYIKSI